MHKFKKGDKVICIDSSTRQSLTNCKTYIIDRVVDDVFVTLVELTSSFGNMYSIIRFIPWIPAMESLYS